jgi:hypothetical protein
VSKRRSKDLRAYSARARVWKAGKFCAAQGLRLSDGSLFCNEKPHLCDHVHHSRGRANDMLMREEFWIPLCDIAHGKTHSHPAEAKALRLIQGPWNHLPRETNV